MSNIPNIISIIENELHQMLSPYQKKINELEIENKKLLNDLTILIDEKNRLIEELSRSKNKKENEAKDNDSKNPNLAIDDKKYETIDHLFLTSSVDNSLLLLEHFYNYMVNDELEKVHYLLELYCHNPEPLLHDDQSIKNIVNSIFNEVILSGKENEFIDKILASFFKLFSALYRTPHKDYLSHFLRQNYPELLENALYSNEPKTIIRFLRLLLKYQFENELKEAIAHIIKAEWGFLDFNVSKSEFCFFLWYSFLFDLDQDLLDLTEESSKWVEEKNSVFQLYSFMYDGINAGKVDNDRKLKELYHSFDQNKIFNERETKRIMKKVQNELDPLIVTKSPVSLPTYTSALYIVEPRKLKQLIKELKLIKKEVLVPLCFSNGFGQKSGKYANVFIYMTDTKKKKMNKQKAFVDIETVGEIHKKYQPEKIKAEIYMASSLFHNEKKTTAQNNNSFQWPSTELNENSLPDSQEQPTLNENSDLKKLGYQITGLTKEKRWTILQKAVPELGLKKVAYTIAYNVRLRKGQKNGHTKFKYAITEWEYDLYKLKKTYYKKDFTWPSV